MAVIKKQQLREMTPGELGKRLGELRLELSKERAQIALGGSPKNPGRVRELRRTIARILNRMRELEAVTK